MVRSSSGISRHLVDLPIGKVRDRNTVRCYSERQIRPGIRLCAFGQGHDLLECRRGRCQPNRVFCKLIRSGQKPPAFCFKDDMEVLMVGHFNIGNASIGIIFLVHDCDGICVRQQTTDMLHHSF